MNGVPYASGVGSLMYATVCIKPYLAYAVSMVSRYMANPGRFHWEALKWVLTYLNGTTKLGLLFERTENVRNPLEGFVDSDFAGNADSRKSGTDCVFTLHGTTVSWRSFLQSVVTLSTTEAEYIAMIEAVRDAMWLKGII